MRHKVIFDTNTLRSEGSVTNFFGGRTELECFLGVSEIILPDLVVREVNIQKKKFLTKQQSVFISNPFHQFSGVDIDKTINFDIDRFLSELVQNERIDYTVISLSENKQDILDRMVVMALNNQPPFCDSSDRGFKDAYIYFTILEYLENTNEKSIFFVTKDNLLAKAFDQENRIKVIKDFKEFEGLIDNYFREQYFINRLEEEIGLECSADDIDSAWLNINDNWVLRINHQGHFFHIEVDFSSKEIISFTSVNFLIGINNLITSPLFSSTHKNIERLEKYKQYFSNAEIKHLIDAATENGQIMQIAQDIDVKDFFVSIYSAKSKILSQEKKELFKLYFID